MKEQQLVFDNALGAAIDRVVADMAPTRLFVITDTNVERHVLPTLLPESRSLRSASVITVGPGDAHKNLTTLTSIWEALECEGADRRSAAVCLGGGVVTDMGGFAAATFKRGIRFVNVPTTLLAAVDAAVGGKTGINFQGLKNEIGAFAPADAVIISTSMLPTLPARELLSGYAEMLKHGLLDGPETFAELLSFDIAEADPAGLLPLLRRSVMVKKRVVDADPTEQGLRKALNLGHTPGHAFESRALAAGAPVPHGFAVAWGLVVDAVLSAMKLGFSRDDLRALASFVRANYGSPMIECADYPSIIELMRHDKKNVGGADINFTLLDAPGRVHIDAICTPAEITAALDIFRTLMGD